MGLLGCVWWACALLAVYAQQDSLFTISIDIGGEQPEELPVRDGDVPSRLAEAFAQKHGLNDRAANTIAQAILRKAEELTQDENPGAPAGGVQSATGKPVLFSLSINIGGTAVPLDVRDGDIPKSIAAAFAKEHKVTLAPRTILAYYSGKLLPIHVACHVSSPIVSCLSCESSAQLDGTAQDKITQAIINKATEIRRTSSGASAPAAAPSIPAAAEPPATGAAANAAAATDATGVSKDGGPQRLLFSLDVNLGGAQGKVPLDVHAGAVPADLAQQFATQYGLGSTAVAQLTEAIVSEAKQKVRATSDPGSVARAPG